MKEINIPQNNVGLNRKKSESEIIEEKLRPTIEAMLANPRPSDFRTGSIHFIAQVLTPYLGNTETSRIIQAHKDSKGRNNKDSRVVDPFRRYAGIINEIVHEIKGDSPKRKLMNQPSVKRSENHIDTKKAPEVQGTNGALRETEIQGELFPGINANK